MKVYKVESAKWFNQYFATMELAVAYIEGIDAGHTRNRIENGIIVYTNGRSDGIIGIVPIDVIEDKNVHHC